MYGRLVIGYFLASSWLAVQDSIEVVSIGLGKKLEIKF